MLKSVKGPQGPWKIMSPQGSNYIKDLEPAGLKVYKGPAGPLKDHEPAGLKLYKGSWARRAQSI